MTYDTGTFEPMDRGKSCLSYTQVSLSGVLIDTDFLGETVRCRMCDNWYVHPQGAIGGLGKCHQCFTAQYDAEAADVSWRAGGNPPGGG